MATAYIDNTSDISENLKGFLDNPLPKGYVGLIAGYHGIHLAAFIKREKYDFYTKEVRTTADRVEKDIKGSIHISSKPVAGREEEMKAFLNDGRLEMLRRSAIASYIRDTLDEMTDKYKKDETCETINTHPWMMKWFTFITLARRYHVIPQDLNNGWAQQKGNTITIKVGEEQVVIGAPSNTDEVDTFVQGILNKVKKGGKKA